MWYVVRVGGPGRGSGLKIVSGPHKDEITANKFIKKDNEEIWSLKLCRSHGLISKGE